MNFRAKAWLMLALAAAGVGAFWAWKSSHAYSGPAATAYAGSQSCRECHADVYAHWAKSNHGLAERSVRPELDQAAFFPARTFRHGGQSSSMELTGSNFFITSVGLSGKPEAHPIERVIGNDPLRQFLTATSGGRWQTMEAAYDPKSNQWFNVFGSEDRQPGEWGHWTGRGLNWNSMCADCHNTGLRKNYDEAADTYHTTMAEPTVACEACHGPLQPHVEWRRKHPQKGTADSTISKPSPRQVMDTCASCHARRAELTGEFKPGDAFFDHFDLTIADHSDGFYPDGQVRDEDYEFTAFLGSRMHQAGVTCIDCHPQSPKQPQLAGNALCLRCHATGNLKAPIISPEAHSHHLAGSKGDACIACHMPVTTYMQRHERHDHGLTIPDPLLTKKFGIPNACNRCHADQDTEWSLAAAEKWYGRKMERPSRRRAEWIALARKGDSAAREPLLGLLQSETNGYWRAVAAGLLDQWVGDARVNDALVRALADGDPLVRSMAVRSLEPLAGQPASMVSTKVGQLLADPVRNVRVSAAWVLRRTLDTNSSAGRALLKYLSFNSDQPVGQMQEGVFQFDRGNLPEALEHYKKSVTWDPNSAPLRHEYAVVLSAANRNREAIAELEAACRLAPKEADYFYKLGLACNEVGDAAKTMESLETAVKLDPRHGKAWYNLGLARNSAGQADLALEALSRAESVSPDDANIPYARATILAREGRTAEARTAVQRALELAPNFSEAAQLLQSLSR